MRLSPATLGRLAAEVVRPAYDWQTQRAGIVHFGIGAFARAHLAAYTDATMAAGDRDWRITGVSLRSGDVAAQLNPQAGLYTLTARSGEASRTRLIGSVGRVIVAPQDPQAVIAAVAHPDTCIVSLTVTEKGYVRAADGSLDCGNTALAADLEGEGSPRTIYGFLAAGLARRRAAGLPGLTLLSCDNLADNGCQLAALMTAYLDRTDPALSDWFARECRCPSTMVDRIVPAMTDADRSWVAGHIGMADAGAILTEAFTQWVIEDDFAGPRPRWEAVGVQFVPDVRAHEAAKLRMLNGAHSALAYLGLERGHDFVHQAVADPAIRPLIEQIMREEAAATLDPASGIDTATYADRLLERFANSALSHRLLQIAMDGTQKIPQRWLEPLAINQAAGRMCPATLEALAAWCRHVRGDVRSVDDPQAATLAALWQTHGPEGMASALFGEGGQFAATWKASPGALAALSQRLA
ncbi:mannitol dehydrogenase family protein [Porphyrobacter sp. YT40]|uniref:mannitol dehydrogenase family protein n=1 Tax=Porphyrobacter sp. YT40 TaxID=2547601 RepID=UPI001145128A|nr:mannitol dehydrogenase family protein [Porphyrobacter sp. YT40]QDH33336.1 mannitol dehydrogenase family protein [Porphyrobacter sp. YT40]